MVQMGGRDESLRGVTGMLRAKTLIRKR